ncbi:MAG: FecR domain-containing protein [Chitinophagaceae bacterium]|nr:FecR domain-containing protein [Chitinophagaceae bacterium]
MKNLIVFLSALLGLTAVTKAQIPFGVSAKEIILTQSVDVDITMGYIKSTGKLGDYVYKAGNRTGVHLNKIEYELKFWNVGALGGSSGMLWWKKTYADAILTIHYSIDNPGFVIGDPHEDKLFPGKPFYPIVPATSSPDVDDIEYNLTFAGGPSGEFAEKSPYRDGDQLVARMPGTDIKFSYKGQRPYGNDRSPIGMSELLLNPMEFPVSAFSDWGNKEELGLVDCGARFNSLSGHVEVRHDAEPNGWKSAQLEMVLYVDDHVRTFEESSSIISFADMSTFVTKEETEIVVNSPPSKANKLKLVTGKIMANIKKMMKDGTMEIDMTQCAATIKGTTFILESSASISTLKVIEGTVDFTSKANGKTVKVSDGQIARANNQGVSMPEMADLSTDKTEWDHFKSVADQNPLKQIQNPVKTDKKSKSTTKVIINERSGSSLPWYLIPGLVLIAGLIVFLVIKQRKKISR